MIHTSMFQKHIHKVKFYPSADDFTQALLVMLVTNIMSGSLHDFKDHGAVRVKFSHPVAILMLAIAIIVVFFVVPGCV